MGEKPVSTDREAELASAELVYSAQDRPQTGQREETSPGRQDWNRPEENTPFGFPPLPGAGERPMQTSARQIGSWPPSEEKPGAFHQVEWTAPGLERRSAELNRRPAELAHRQLESSQPAPAPRMSDRELKRAADQVYQMIEDRLRRERRRLDL